MSDWQPIGTAPKDGTRILAWANRLGWERDGYSCVTVEWHGHRWAVMGARDNKEWPDTKDECSPSHWMPLPSAPPAKQ